MLTVLRKLSETWIFKGILALTALSFVSLFGVGSFSNLKRGDNIAVSTDAIEITNEDFFREFTNQISKLNKILGRNLSMKEAIDQGIYVPMLVEKANEFTMFSLDKELNIDLSPASLGQVIRSQSTFLDEDGRFSSAQYSYYLSNMGISVAEFENKMAKDIKNRFISSPMMGAVLAPDTLANEIYKYQNEKRAGSYFEIKLSDMEIVKTPKDSELKPYYEGFEDNFMAPEYRRATVLFVPYDRIKSNITVPDDELKARYEEVKDSYTVPEKREIEQILVSDKEKADKIVEALKKENDFVKIAKDMAGQNKEDTSLGLVTINSLIPEIADIAFEAKKGEIVGPIESYLGFHIVKISNIVEGSVASFDEKKAEIMDTIKSEKMADVTTNLIEKIDDAFGVGKTLEDTAKELNAKVVVIDDIDIGGIKRDGTKFSDDFINDEFLGNLYSSSMEVGQVSVTMESEKGLSVFRLDNIEAPTVKEFSEVKEDLKKLWEADEKQSLLDAKIAEMAKDVDDKMSFSKISAKYKTNVKETGNVSRVSANKDTALEVVDALFRISGDKEIIRNKTNEGYVFVALNRIISPDKNNEDVDIVQVKDDLRNEIADSLYAEFLNVLGNRYNLTVNNEGVVRVLDTYKNKINY